MRSLRLLVFILISGAAFSQALPTDPETKKITWQEKVAVDSVSKDELFERAKNWLGHFYKTDKFIPNDPVNGKIGKENGFFLTSLSYDFKYKAEYTVTYDISIDIKDGRYRFTITNFKTYKSKEGVKTIQSLEAAHAKMSNQNKTEMSTQVNKEVNALIEDLKKLMVTGKIPNKEDW